MEASICVSIPRCFVALICVDIAITETTHHGCVKLTIKVGITSTLAQVFFHLISTRQLYINSGFFINKQTRQVGMAHFAPSSDIKASLAKNIELQVASQSRMKKSNAVAEAVLRRKHAAEEAKITKKNAKTEGRLSDDSDAHQIKVKDENAAYLAEVVAINANDRASMRQIDQAYENHAERALEAYKDYAAKVEELLERHNTDGKQPVTAEAFTTRMQELNTMVNDKLIENNSILKEAQRVANAYTAGMNPALKPRVVKARGWPTITRNKTTVNEESLQTANGDDSPSSHKTVSGRWGTAVKNQAKETYEQKIIILDPHQAAALNAKVREIQDKVREDASKDSLPRFLTESLSRESMKNCNFPSMVRLLHLGIS